MWEGDWSDADCTTAVISYFEVHDMMMYTCLFQVCSLSPSGVFRSTFRMGDNRRSRKGSNAETGIQQGPIQIIFADCLAPGSKGSVWRFRWVLSLSLSLSPIFFYGSCKRVQGIHHKIAVTRTTHHDAETAGRPTEGVFSFSSVFLFLLRKQAFWRTVQSPLAPIPQAVWEILMSICSSGCSERPVYGGLPGTEYG